MSPPTPPTSPGGPTPPRSPERALEGAVRRVLRDDGSVDPAADPGLSLDALLGIHRAMVRGRIVDLALEKLQRQGRVGFHVGALGEEAAIVASAAALSAEDYIFPCYREASALLARGMPLSTYVDHMFGNAADPMKGRQMPDHYSARRLRFGSVSSPIGTQLCHAVGLAYGIARAGLPEVAAVYFGDGATSSNDFHAAMTFAGVWRAPVVFLLRNNRWAISLPVDKQCAAEHLVDKAQGYGVASIRCDGNDALAVYATVREARARALAGEGPTLVELETYRRGSHSTSDEPRVYRDDAEVALWDKLDPIRRVYGYLVASGAWDEEREHALGAEVQAEIKAAVAASEQKPAPPLASLFEDVYAELPWHLREQREECEEGPRPR